MDARTFEDLGRKQREIAEAEAALKEQLALMLRVSLDHMRDM